MIAFVRARRILVSASLATCSALAACSGTPMIDPVPVLHPSVVQGEWLGVDALVPGSATILLTIDEDGAMVWDEKPGSQRQTLRQPRVWRGRVAWNEQAWSLLFEREGEEPLRMRYQDGSLSTFTLHPLDRDQSWPRATFIRLKLVRERLATLAKEP